LILRLTFRAAALVLLLGCFSACDHEDRIGQLEKQGKELQAEKDRITDFDLQGKCAKDARVWFESNWRRDKDTALLTYTNHYNKKQNKCFIEVEFHYNSPTGIASETLWVSHISLWNLYENSQYADYSENHYSDFKPQYNTRDEVITCEVTGTKCKTLDQFNNLTRQYMAD
jgi:hypothetical protein